MDIFNLISSVVYIFIYIFFIILEVIIGVVIIVKIDKSKRMKVFRKLFIIVSLSLFIFYIMGTPNPKIDIERELNYNELVGKWNLTDIAKKGKEKASKYPNFIELNKNGLCKFNSIDYNSSEYIDSSCQWSLKHNIKADNSLYENNVVTILLNISLGKRYFYFKQQGNELILYNYYLNDWYDKIEYRREE